MVLSTFMFIRQRFHIIDGMHVCIILSIPDRLRMSSAFSCERDSMSTPVSQLVEAASYDASCTCMQLAPAFNKDRKSDALCECLPRIQKQVELKMLSTVTFACHR